MITSGGDAGEKIETRFTVLCELLQSVSTIEEGSSSGDGPVSHLGTGGNCISTHTMRCSGGKRTEKGAIGFNCKAFCKSNGFVKNGNTSGSIYVCWYLPSRSSVGSRSVGVSVCPLLSPCVISLSFLPLRSKVSVPIFRVTT